MGMSLTSRRPSEKVLDLLDELRFRLKDPHDIIDLAILLTVLSYDMITIFEKMEIKEFLDKWTTILKRNIEELGGD